MGNFQLEDFVAGWVGGAASVIVGHPLDTVKTRLQAGQGYRNTLNCVFTVYRNETVAGFFKGMSFPLASIAVYSSVVFGVFSNTQRFICQHRYGDSNHASTVSDLVVASMVAGFVSVGIGCPVDLVKIRLQMQTQPFIQDGLRDMGKAGFLRSWKTDCAALCLLRLFSQTKLRCKLGELNSNINLKPQAAGFPVQTAYRGPVHCISSILRKEGLAGIYRGAGAMVLRDVPGYCLYFIPYTFLCEWFTSDGRRSPSPSSVWIAGGIAGAISWGTATPMDVVKSRLQADGVHLNKYKGVIDCISQSYHNEGLKVFFRSMTINAVRGFPMSAAMFLGYELSLKTIRGVQADINP
ncbi:solute carrier family 25 member 48 isoform X1 [Alligator mississippiensis]|uniref:solute carrier family 25 member 48 isoform X1 n=1 Tax=Alligator mississippiensis TaxID=8496 RepID=UPI0009071387|nr:solute carrier family 25 member 48 isoform X1 [Alligator mississippiensis]